jgi:membrane protein DedA with SNARE-associated domain
MIPLFRSFISIPAGIERMSMPTFLGFTALGSLIWNVIFVLAGYQLGENWRTLQEYVGVYKKAVVAAVVVAVAVFVAVRLRRSRRGVERV